MRGFEIDKKMNILVSVDVSCDVESFSPLIFRVCMILGRILVKTLFFGFGKELSKGPSPRRPRRLVKI